MARFDIFENQGEHKKTTPYLLDVQIGLLEAMGTRVVIPLRSVEHVPKMQIPKELMPIFAFNSEELILETPKMAAVPTKILKHRVGNLAEQHHMVVAAIDFLFHGY